MSVTNLTEKFFNIISDSTEIKKTNLKKYKKALDWLDENGSDIYESDNGNYFLYKSRTSSYPRGISKYIKIPKYVFESLCEVLEITSIVKESLFIKVQDLNNGQMLIFTETEFSKHKFEEVTKGVSPIKRIGYASLEEVSAEIDKSTNINTIKLNYRENRELE